jgi:nucleoside-diphosphate-sugar epimerase
MKLLITGALGHIGSRLMHSLRPGDFDEVVLLDNLATQRYGSLFNLPDQVRFRFVEADICAVPLEKIFAGVDVVIHLAALTNAAGSFEMQGEVERVNFQGTERVARACVAAGCRLVFLSTTSVYGVQTEVVDEFCPLESLKPQSPYADSKIRSEGLLAELGCSHGLRFVICRFGTVYGVSPGMRFHTAVNKFAWQACAGLPVTVWRSALHQRRPYLDLGDAVRALRFVIERDGFDREIYNVLTDNLTVNDVLEALRTFVDDVKVDFVDTKIMNQLSYTVANARFRALGFEFTGDYRQALGDTVRRLQNMRVTRTRG